MRGYNYLEKSYFKIAYSIFDKTTLSKKRKKKHFKDISKP